MKYNLAKDAKGINDADMRIAWIEKYRQIPRIVWLLGFISFFNDIASEMLYPVIPIFLTQVLGAPVAVLGLIEGIAEGVASLFKGYFGSLSDRLHKRKAFVVAGYSCSALAKIIIALSTNWPIFLLGRTTDRFGKGVRNGARDAMLYEASHTGNRGLVFGLHRSMDSAGAVLGPLIAILLLQHTKNIRLILYVATIPTIASIYLFFFLKEKLTDAKPADRKTFFVSLKGFSPRFYILLCTIGLFSLGNSSDTFLILRAQNLGMSLTMVILAYVLYNTLYTLLSTPAGGVSDTLGPKKVMLVGIAIYMLVYAGFAFNTSVPTLWLLFSVYGAYIALTDGISKALVSTLIHPEQAGAAYGTLQMVTGISTFFASLIAGLLWSVFSPTVTFLFAVGCALLAFVTLLFLPMPKSKNM